MGLKMSTISSDTSKDFQSSIPSEPPSQIAIQRISEILNQKAGCRITIEVTQNPLGCRIDLQNPGGIDCETAISIAHSVLPNYMVSVLG